MINYSQSLDGLFHALADPTRRAMVARLDRGPATVSDLARPLKMSLPAVMQHLDVLTASGLVRTEKTGRVRTCRVDPKAMLKVDRWLTQRRSAWERNFDRLGDYLAATSDESDSGGKL